MSGSGAEFANANVELLERISAWASQRPDILTQLSHAYLVVGRVDDAKEVALRAKELVPEAKFAYWNLLNIYVVTNDVENIKLTLEKIFMINIKQNNFLPGTDIALTESEARQLGTLMTQAEQNNQPEIKQAIEAYFTQ